MTQAGLDGFEVNAGAYEKRRLRVAKLVHLQVGKAQGVAIPLLLVCAPPTLEISGIQPCARPVAADGRLASLHMGFVEPRPRSLNKSGSLMPTSPSTSVISLLSRNLRPQVTGKRRPPELPGADADAAFGAMPSSLAPSRICECAFGYVLVISSSFALTVLLGPRLSHSLGLGGS